MAQPQRFKMKFGGYSAKEATAEKKGFCKIRFLEEVSEFGSERVNTIDMYCDEVPKDIKAYKLYDDVLVDVEMSLSSGGNPKFVSMKPYVFPFDETSGKQVGIPY